MIDKEIIEDIFDQYKETIVAAVKTGWNYYKEMPDAGKLAKRTRANVVWDITVQAAVDNLRGESDIHIIPIYDTVWFRIEPDILFRFKKGDRRGLSRNYPTQASLDFNNPQQQLPGIPEIQRFDVVYVLDEFETEIEDILIVSRNGNKTEWTSSIMEAGSAEVVRLHANQAEEKGPRIIIKKEIQDDSTKKRGEHE